MEIHELNTRDSLTAADFFAVDNGTDTAKTAYSALSAAVLGDITGAASSVINNNLTASRVAISNSSGKIGVSSITTTVLNRLSGLTENVQTALDGIGVTETSGIINNVALTAGAYKDVCSLTLQAGTWIVNAHATVTSAASSGFTLAISGAARTIDGYTYAPNATATPGSVAHLVTLTAATALTMKIYTNASGATANTAWLDAVRIR